MRVKQSEAKRLINPQFKWKLKLEIEAGAANAVAVVAAYGVFTVGVLRFDAHFDVVSGVYY